MFVMSKVSICLSLFRFTVVIITALACTENALFFLKEKRRRQKSLKRTPADAEIKVPLLRTQSCEHFPVKAASRSEYSPACFTCCLEFLACPNFYLTGSFIYTFVLYCLHFKLN